MKTMKTKNFNFWLMTILCGIFLLSSTQIFAQTCTPPPAGMVAWFPGDGNANDIQGSNNGTINGGVTFPAGKVAQAFSFDGTGDVTYSTINAGSAYTIDFWVRPSSGGPTASRQEVIGNNFQDAQSFGQITFTNTQIEYFQGGGIRVVSAAGSVPFDAYTHVALTYDGSVNRLYINGNLVATSAVHTETFNNPIKLGNSVLQVGNARFNGQLDEVEIFTRALSQTEIQAIVTADSAGKCKSPITFIVNTTSDANDGECNQTHCSLREAIIAANSAPSQPDRIEFNIPGGGQHTIAPTSSLPAITDPVVIDGYTQPGATPNTAAANTSAPLDTQLRIELDGTNATAGANGLVIFTSNSVVRGLAINRFIKNSASNTGNGIYIIGSGNLVEGCFLGTDPGGTQDLGNRFAGVLIFTNGQNNRIGGTTPAARNLISGNDVGGISAQGTGTTNNLVEGNFIGTDRTGSAALPNQTGIYTLAGASNLTIGGAAAGARNVISGNSLDGIFLGSAGGGLIQNNLIGTKADGTTALGNVTYGVRIQGTSNNQIGGTGANEGNVIAFNGIGITIFSGTGNRIFSNSIHSNGTLGIDLGGDGVTPNDAGDADTGANNLQNYPVLSSAGTSGNTTLVSGTLNSTPNTQFRIEFFSNAACDPSGFGEGQFFMGSQSVTTDASGNATINFNPSFTVSAGQFITSTATDPSGNTSEFSNCRQVASPSAASVSIGGRVMTATGRGIRNVRLILTDSAGATHIAFSNAFGYYRFADIPAGATYVISATGKRYVFDNPTQALFVSEETSGINFIASP